MSANRLALKGREYRRVSVDRSGRQKSPAEQGEENAVAAGTFNVELGEPYVDTGSASRYAQKARKDFDRLVSDLAADRFGAAVLVLWESSRGSRRVGEWVTLIELCEERGVRILVTTHGRLYDPSNERDRRSLLEDAVDSEYESAKVSTRVKRDAAASARAGRPRGTTPYGYIRRYEVVNGRSRLVGQELDPVTAPVVREMYERIVKGHSLRSIALDLNAAGRRTSTGEEWTGARVRALVLNQTYAGERVHVPGHRSGPRRGTTTKAMWPSLVDMATWVAVEKILTDPARTVRRPGAAKHLLSLLAMCDVCDGELTATYRHSEDGHYNCRPRGCVTIALPGLEEYVVAVVLAYLARADVFEALQAADQRDDAELAQVRNELAEAERYLRDLRQRVKARAVSLDTLIEVEPDLIATVDRLKAQERALQTPSTLRGIIEPGEHVAEQWAQMPLAARREVLRILLAPELLGEVRVKRSLLRGRGRVDPVEERVVWRRPE